MKVPLGSFIFLCMLFEEFHVRFLRNKVVSKLDLFVIDFIKILERYTDYVIVSGYVSILFGRSRGTEDIDIFIEKIDFKKFKQLNDELRQKKYWFLNAENPLELYGMLNDKLAIRAAIQDTVIPNIEIKFTKNRIDKDSLQKHMEVKIDQDSINISPLEIQIPFKLYLGSDKDIEDAVYLYELFGEHLNKEKLKQYMDLLKVEGNNYGIEF